MPKEVIISRSEPNQVSVKVPAFWPESAEAWFVQVEAQFALKGVTASLMKFYYCVSSFNQETANQVLDLIKSPRSSEPYEALKNQLLKLFALDDFQRYEAISSLPLSGDMKPSKLMSSMLALLPVGHKPRFFLRGAFLKRLPADVQAHLLRDDFSVPPPHHVPQQPPAEVPASLTTAKFVFVREDASKPSLAPLVLT